MARELTCRATTAEGTPCRAPSSVIDPVTQLCASHAPGAAERLREQGKRGGATTARKFKTAGLSSEELGDLNAVEDAQRWLRLIALAVGSRELTHSEGAAMTRGVEAWMKAEDVRLRSEDLRELQEQVAELSGRKTARTAA